MKKGIRQSKSLPRSRCLAQLGLHPNCAVAVIGFRITVTTHNKRKTSLSKKRHSRVRKLKLKGQFFGHFQLLGSYVFVVLLKLKVKGFCSTTVVLAPIEDYAQLRPL